LIVGIDNKKELVDSFLSKKNNNTIIITTIQKLGRAIRECRDTEKNSFKKLKGEHIVFIVDECHRAVSDRQMKEIKKFFPRSTWIGLTGTPIFEENQKAEKGMYARTTSDQYGVCKSGKPLSNGGLLHAYTTKNAMDDKSVLNFMVEYHSLMSEEEEKRLYLNKIKAKYPKADPIKRLKTMLNDVEKETLLENADFENDEYIETMLKKIFRHDNVINKFNVVNGVPTMSGILTTHSIAQAKHIYYKLLELKEGGKLITGNPIDERRRLYDPDFPRVAITYSVVESEDEQSKAQREIAEIMENYKKLFGIGYTDVDSYNRNINNRLARKSVQYQTNGQWLDLVIVVDRLLTGFDAPTIQTLYVDKELRWHGLLQAFSRTNRIFPGKKEGMIVTFRKPATMAQNVRDAIKLFSNEARDWEKLVPREYKEVKQEFIKAFKTFQASQRKLEENPNDLKNKIETVKAFQVVKNLDEAIKSYEGYADEYNEDSPILSIVSETINGSGGHIENLKSEIKRELEEQGAGDNEIQMLLEIEFSADQRANLEEKIDSYYISMLLKDIRNEGSRQKFNEIIKDKPEIVKSAYDEALDATHDESKIVGNVDQHFRCAIDGILTETANILKVPLEDLSISFNEYRLDKDEVPYINTIIDKIELSKEEFEQVFLGELYRRRSYVIHEYLREIFTDKLLPLRGELANFQDEREGF
jgi:type I restriction enzyme R subunit